MKITPFLNADRNVTSTTVLDPPSLPTETASVRRSFLLVFCCTLIGAIAQIFIKQGTASLGARVTLGSVFTHPSLILQFILGMMRNLKLFLGYSMYGVNTFLMAMALKGRELSRLYPIIALTYVWVTLLSLFLFQDEHMNFFRAIGIAFVVGGVSILGVKK
jgi:multidrug transporter EmrE-like cation transporter